MRLCVDCRHFDGKTAECTNAPFRSPVTGANRFYFAEVERQARTTRACGPAALHFVPKVTPDPNEPPF